MTIRVQNSRDCKSISRLKQKQNDYEREYQTSNYGGNYDRGYCDQKCQENNDDSNNDNDNKKEIAMIEIVTMIMIYIINK